MGRSQSQAGWKTWSMGSCYRGEGGHCRPAAQGNCKVPVAITHPTLTYPAPMSFDYSKETIKKQEAMHASVSLPPHCITTSEAIPSHHLPL